MTNEKIAPRIDDDGVPWCVTSCPYFVVPAWPLGCESQAADEACVPALRHQRDEARAKIERLREEASEWQQIAALVAGDLAKEILLDADAVDGILASAREEVRRANVALAEKEDGTCEHPERTGP